MNDLELGWVAGIIEGEGCISVWPPRVTLEMTDRDVVEKFAMLVGSQNKISTRYRTQNGRERKDIYVIRVYGRKATELMKLVLPHMSGRRKSKILESLNHGDHPFKEQL